MATVTPAPRIRCDNCGRMEDKSDGGTAPPGWCAPKGWGSCRIEIVAGTYPPRIGMSDLCPICVKAAYDAAGKALEKTRSEGFDGPTGAE